MGSSSDSASPAPPIFAPGEVLSDTYEIRSLLGEGARGQVFEAHDRALNRRVAIKAGRPGSNPAAIRKEAQALAAIRHPGMVSVYALGIHEGVEFVVMERLYGTSLESHLDRYRLRNDDAPLDEVLDILTAVTDALAAVHRAGIAHRDVKPANVMLTPGNRVVLVDLGLFLPEFEIASQTRIAGSPPYMAPEAVTRKIEAGAGHLVDLYALGAMAHEMLTGDPPFLADTPREVMKLHLSAAVPDVSLERPGLPPRMTNLVRDLLAKEPRDRPQSADAVLFVLRRIRADLAREDGAYAPPSSSTLHVARPAAPPLGVLIVDDDPDVARVLLFYVKKAVPEADVRVVHDGEAALEAVRKREPDLMLLDLEMPRTNGLEVMMLLRGAGLAERATIVTVSASAEDHDIQILRQLGVSDFVAKGAALAEKVGLVAQNAQAALAQRKTPPSRR